MKITCPGCNSTYFIPAHTANNSNVRIRCKLCKTIIEYHFISENNTETPHTPPPQETLTPTAPKQPTPNLPTPEQPVLESEEIIEGLYSMDSAEGGEIWLHTILGLGRGIVLSFQHIKMWLLFWFVSFATALLLITPLFTVLQKTLGKSLHGNQLSKQFEFGWIFELLQQTPLLPLYSLTLAIIVLVIALLLHTFMLGGALYLFHHSNSKFSFGNFFHGAGLHFLRFFRLLLYSVLFYGLYYWGYTKWGAALDSLVKSNLHEPDIAKITWLKAGLFLLGFGGLKLFVDLIRIRLVVEDSTRVTVEIFRTLGFFLKHIFSLILLAAFFVLVGIVAWVIYNTFQPITRPGLGLSLLWLFLAQQAYILTRIWLRLVAQASYLSFYKDLRQ